MNNKSLNQTGTYWTFYNLGKLVQTEDILRSMRPFSIDKDMDQDVKDQLLAHLRPLVNIIYTKGQYYVYQADSLLKEPGLTADLA